MLVARFRFADHEDNSLFWCSRVCNLYGWRARDSNLGREVRAASGTKSDNLADLRALDVRPQDIGPRFPQLRVSRCLVRVVCIEGIYAVMLSSHDRNVRRIR